MQHLSTFNFLTTTNHVTIPSSISLPKQIVFSVSGYTSLTAFISEQIQSSIRQNNANISCRNVRANVLSSTQHHPDSDLRLRRFAVMYDIDSELWGADALYWFRHWNRHGCWDNGIVCTFKWLHYCNVLTVTVCGGRTF